MGNMSSLGTFPRSLWTLKVDVDQEEIEDRYQSIVDRHEAPKGPAVPADLHDKDGHMLVTADGMPVAGRMLVQDVAEGSHSPVSRIIVGAGAPLLMACVLLQMGTGLNWPSFIIMWGWALCIETGLGAFCGVLFSYQALAATIYLGGWAALLTGFGWSLVLAIWPFILLCMDKARRREMLMAQVKEQPISPENKALALAREKQAENASRDVSPFIELGRSVGYLHEFAGDMLAPDKDMPMGLSANDTSTHLCVVGGTGSGKTSGVFRPLVKEWAEKQAGGLLVMDGKGQLPAELTSIPNYQLVTPETAKLGLVEGLTAEDVTDVIVTFAMKGVTEDDPTWSQNAAELLKNSGLLLEAANQRNPEEHPWTLANIARVARDKAYRAEIGQLVKTTLMKQPLTELEKDSVVYFQQNFERQPEKFQGSVVGTMNGWLAPIFGHRQLRDWCHTAQGVDLAEVFTGARIGLSLPRATFGEAGSAITEMCKIRIYRAAQRRGDGWKKVEGQTSCLLCIDEAQEVLGAADLDMAPIARSLGTHLVVGFQAVEQLADKFGNAGADALLSQFQSVIAFRTSPRSLAWLCARMGEAKKVKATVQAKGYSFQHALLQKASDPTRDENNPDFEGFVPKVAIYEKVQGVKDVLSTVLGGHGEVYRVQGEPEPMVDKAALNDHLSVPFRTIAIMFRAGVWRRDFMDVNPIFGD